jgi:hypothetical protein
VVDVPDRLLLSEAEPFGQLVLLQRSVAGALLGHGVLPRLGLRRLLHRFVHPPTPLGA